jgi:hypothetical protein
MFLSNDGRIEGLPDCVRQVLQSGAAGQVG